jgi:hypothetical protein
MAFKLNGLSIRGIEESVTYQAIVEEGMLRAERAVLLQLGRKRFGPPIAMIEMAIYDIADYPRISRLVEALLDVTSWEEQLATP